MNPETKNPAEFIYFQREVAALKKFSALLSVTVVVSSVVVIAGTIKVATVTLEWWAVVMASDIKPLPRVRFIAVVVITIINYSCRINWRRMGFDDGFSRAGRGSAESQNGQGDDGEILECLHVYCCGIMLFKWPSM